MAPWAGGLAVYINSLYFCTALYKKQANCYSFLLS
jgi:hypothetical protein